MLKTIQESKIHDHTCLIFTNTTEFFHCAIPFIREGLKNNEKCYIVIDDITEEEVFKKFKYLFKTRENPLHEIRQDDKIVIEQFQNIYLNNDKFTIDNTLKNYISILNKAISDGYNGLRVFAEISHSMHNLIGTNDFLIWEKEADKHFAGNNFLAVCAYNKKYFSQDYISQVITVHPVEIDVINTRL